MTKAEADAELENWGRWARRGISNAPRLSPPAFDGWQPSKAWDPGWGDVNAAPESPQPPINEHQAHATDAILYRMPRDHFRALKRHYYRQQKLDWETLDAALRAYIDCAQTKTQCLTSRLGFA